MYQTSELSPAQGCTVSVYVIAVTHQSDTVNTNTRIFLGITLVLSQAAVID